MTRPKDPFVIKETGGDIKDRSVSGFSWRALEGTTLGEVGVATLRRVISQTVPYFWLGGILLVLLVLAVRLLYLQGIQGQYWRNVAEGNRIRLEYLPAIRGPMVDRAGRPLTRNTPNFSLVATPSDLPKNEVERQALLNDLLAQVPPELIHQEEISALSKASYLPQVIASNISRELALVLMVKTAGSKGVKVALINQREYLLGSAAAHILGYVGQVTPGDFESPGANYLLNDSIGKSGLEYTYDGVLRGQVGRKEVEIDALGREQKVYATQAPQVGGKLILTIDSELQQAAYEQLTSVVSQTGKGGSVVALDPTTGEILALVSYPSFDPNIFTLRRDALAIKSVLSDPRRSMYNRPVAGEYPPGSTIKPLLAASGLADGIITTATTVMSTGGLSLGDQFFADWKSGGHGLTNVYKAIAESVNTFFYLLGGGAQDRPGLGINRLDYYFDLFGIGYKTNIDLPGERVGFVPTPKWKLALRGDRWYLGDTYNVSIGQGNLLVTPLRLAVAYAALATDGVIRWPHLVRQILYSDGQVEEINPKELGKLSFSPEVLRAVQQGMRQTVTEGSARSLQAVAWPVAGKTGTAQTGTRTAPHAWFAGYMPAVNPRFLVVVMLENGGEGSSAAVPIARKLFDRYYNTYKQK